MFFSSFSFNCAVLKKGGTFFSVFFSLASHEHEKKNTKKRAPQGVSGGPYLCLPQILLFFVT